MENQEFSKILKDINLSLFKVISKQNKDLGIELTPIQGTIILGIANHKEALCQKEIEEFVSCNKSTLSSILDTMEKRGLIERKTSDWDTRKKVILLTEKSKKFIKQIEKDRTETDSLLMQGISLEERELLIKNLTQILHNLERMM